MGTVFCINQIMQKRRIEHILQSAIMRKVQANRHRNRRYSDNAGNEIQQQVFPFPVSDQNDRYAENERAEDHGIVDANERHGADQDAIEQRPHRRMHFLIRCQKAKLIIQAEQNHRHTEFFRKVAMTEQAEEDGKERKSSIQKICAKQSADFFDQKQVSKRKHTLEKPNAKPPAHCIAKRFHPEKDRALVIKQVNISNFSMQQSLCRD